MSSSLVTWSRSTSESPTSGSSDSSSSNSSDSGFSLMRDTVSGKDGAKLKQTPAGRNGLSTGSLLDQVVHLEDGQQHRKDDGHHKSPHAHDQHGAEQADHAGEQPIQLAFLRNRGTLEHAFQLAARLTARDQVDGHRREKLAHGEGATDRGSFTNSRGGFGHGISHRQIRHNFAGDA